MSAPDERHRDARSTPNRVERRLVEDAELSDAVVRQHLGEPRIGLVQIALVRDGAQLCDEASA